jgi:hypothetical protein
MDLVDWPPNDEETTAKERPRQIPNIRKIGSLFKFYNSNDELLYVAQNFNFAVIRKQEWWSAVDHIDIKHFDSLDALAEAKAVAIYNGDPKWNTHGRRTEVDDEGN